MPITEKDLVRCSVSANDMKVIYENAGKACIGGHSNIYQGEDRMQNLGTDQIVGQIGNFVGTVAITGNADGYHYARQVANANPYSGDGGSDIPGWNIDIKTSLMRSQRFGALGYNLVVRPKERHDNWFYVLALVECFNEVSASAILVGWAPTRYLPKFCEQSGPFRGAYKIKASDLFPMEIFPKYVEQIKTLNPAEYMLQGVST